MLQGDRAGDFEELLEGYTRDFVTSEAAYQGRGMLSGLGFGRTATVEDNAQFDKAMKDAARRKGLRLLHCRTEIENLAASGLKLSTLRHQA